jgi:hypothetical protein
MTKIINGEAVGKASKRSKRSSAVNPLTVPENTRPSTMGSHDAFGPVATVALALRLRSMSRNTGAAIPAGLFDLLKHHASGGDEACALILMDLTTKPGGQQHA